MRSNFRALCSGIGLILFAFSGAAVHASMQLNNVIFHFEPGEPALQYLEIFNPGDEPLYVEITPTQVLAPGEVNEDRAIIRDPRAAGLLVTPNKLIVPPGTTKLVRLVKVGNSPVEKIYRIAAKPVVGELNAETSGVKVLIGYEVLAIIYPNNPQPELEVAREGRTLSVKNVGNSNVLLREGFQCDTPELPREECTPLPGRRLYPGNEWRTELPEDLPVTYYQSVGKRNFVKTYP